MGLCASSPMAKPKPIAFKSKAAATQTFSSSDTIWNLKPQTITVIHVGAGTGKFEEFKQPIVAKLLLSQNRDCFLCSSESMSIGACPSRVFGEEELQVGQIYFMLPLSIANEPLSLPDLCGLAIKASSAVAKDAVEFSSGKPAIVFR